MGFVQDVASIMNSALATGKSHVRFDELAAKLNEIKPGYVVPTDKLLAGEVLAKRIEAAIAMAEGGDIDFPYEVASWRERASKGVPEMEGVIYKSLPLKVGTGDNAVVKKNRDGQEAMQNYYWPALVPVNPDKLVGKTEVASLYSDMTRDLAGLPYTVEIVQDGHAILIKRLYAPLQEVPASKAA